jgi:hypothetical protein
MRRFDPLGLGTEPERLKWYAEAEKTNGRCAAETLAINLLPAQPACIIKPSALFIKQV